MSIYDKASLVLIPSGTKTSKVYSQVPTNGDGDFTFSRSTAATRVNASGNIEKETENLLKRSNTFNVAWYVSSSSPTGGQSGYDGTNDAWLLESTASAQSMIIQDISQSGVQTQSIYAKAGTANYLAYYNSAAVYAFFDLAGGSVGSTSANIDAQIESVGGGWYRCSMTYNASIVWTRVYVADANNNFTSAVGSNIYIQDAQLEQGLVARDYIETTTTAIYGGITDNVPRLDYTDSSCPALLLEPQRTNLVVHSEYALGLPQYNSPTIVQNDEMSPEGVQNAFQFTTDAVSFRGVRPEFSITPNGTYTASWFVKKKTSAVSVYCGFGFQFKNGTSQKINYVIFDEYAGTATIIQDGTNNTTTDVIDYGDYYRFIATATDTGSNTTLSFTFYPTLSANGTSPSVASNTIVAYGLQVEAGSYATSYIPTYGSAVTRNEDLPSLFNFQSKGLFGDTSGSIFYEFENVQDLFKGWSISNTKDRYQYVDIAGSANGYFRFRGYEQSFGLQVVNLGATSQIPVGSTTKKLCITWDANEFSLYGDGALLGSVSINDSIAVNSISNYNGNLSNTGDLLREMIWFPTRLSNQEAIDLTTL